MQARKEDTMYPDTYPRDGWYVAATSGEVTDGFLSRWLLGDPVLLYRTGGGEVIALVDRCVHRQMPLSRGWRKDDGVQCSYHGLVFDAEGRCVWMPQGQSPPPRLRVQTYPVIESGGLVWFWPGLPDKADPALLPPHHAMDDPDWRVVRGEMDIEARAQLFHENLLDLSHVTFLHDGSIGTEHVAEAPIETSTDDR